MYHSSGIGRATAILFAMEGADSFIVYLPEEQDDAEETKKRVEKYGRKCYLYPTDLVKAENCKKVVEEALKAMGKIDILFNNAAFQQIIEDPIKDLTEYVIPIGLKEHCSNAKQLEGNTGYTPSTLTSTRWQVFSFTM